MLRCLNWPIVQWECVSFWFTAADYRLSSLNKESKWLLLNVYFAKFSKENVLKWKSWNCYHLRNFIAHPIIFFSNFCDQNCTFYKRSRHQSGQKSHSTWIFCKYLKQLSYPLYDNINRSPTHCENFKQIAQIDYMWCGYE